MVQNPLTNKMKFLIPFLCFISSSFAQDYLRNYYMPFAAAAYSNIPNKCLSNIQKWYDEINNLNDTFSIYRHYKIKCPSLNDTCYGYTAIATTYQDNFYGPIIIAFRGIKNFEHFFVNEWNYNDTVPFIGGGKVSKQFFDAFNMIWINAGMKDDVLTLKNKSPKRNIVVTGHSTGGAMASLAAATMVSTGISESYKILLYTFGEPRTGDKDFANSVHFQQSYRVVHNADIIPHLSSVNDSNYHHHITEWWWPNAMAEGDKFIECSSANGEDPKCSNSLDDSTLNFNDHKTYFGRNFVEYGISGCQDLVSTFKNDEKNPKTDN